MKQERGKHLNGLWLALSAIVTAALVVAAVADDDVEPASVTVTNTRGDTANAQISDTTYYEGSTLRFTNCVLYAGTDTNSSLQGLTGVTVDVDVGNATTNITYTASVTDTNGQWSVDLTVPDFVSATYMQIKLTDANTNSYIYPWKRILTKDSM